MLEIKNLHANVNGKEILKGINLSVKAGEVHAIMGPNGSGKSTLSSVLVGNPAFEVTEGEVTFNGKNLLELSPEDRSREGLFLSFQYPVEIPGVSMVNFMRAAVNEHRKYNGLPPVSATEFLKLMREKRAIVELDNKLASRSVNEGFSGGEKKRNEIFQMAMLEPKLSILDETDSGLDIDALRIVASGVNKLKTANNATIVITHYQRLLDYIKPDIVHVLYKGRIVKTAGPELALELEEKGYDWIKKEMGDFAFYEVHSILGFGFLEQVYQNALYKELKRRGLQCEAQKQLKVYYKNEVVGNYVADIVVNDQVILELKAVSALRPEHEWQLVNYLKATGLKVGLLLNFGLSGEVKRKILT